MDEWHLKCKCAFIVHMTLNPSAQPTRRSPQIKFVRQSALESAARKKGRSDAETAEADEAIKVLARAGFHQFPVRIINRPARYPPEGQWPIEMRADMAAALLDFRTTHELSKALAAGEAPPPSATRNGSGQAEPVWFHEFVVEFVRARHKSSKIGDFKNSSVE